MPHKVLTLIALALFAFTGIAAAQTAPPPFATRKIEGTDNVYLFRYQGHQSMFIVTPKGVIATDPIGRYRPEAVTTYLAEIKKVTDQPVKYLIYSHAHFDHIAGGKPFKDQGATIIAHKNAKAHFEWAKKQNALLDSVVMPDQVVDQKKVISLGGTTLELIYVGRNHSDSSLVMRLPKEKLIFLVDFIPIEGVQFRNMPDNVSPVEYEELDQEGDRARLGSHDSRSSVCGRASWHQEGRAGSPHLPAGAVGGSEESGAHEMHRCRDEGTQAAKIREVVELRAVSPRQHRALLLLVDPVVLRPPPHLGSGSKLVLATRTPFARA